MAGRARTRFPDPQRMREYNAREVRSKIQASKLIMRLQQHVLGECEMSPTQVKAAQVLLDRSLPALSAVEVHHHNEYDGLTEAELMARLSTLLADLPTGARARLLTVLAKDDGRTCH